MIKERADATVVRRENGGDYAVARKRKETRTMEEGKQAAVNRLAWHPPSLIISTLSSDSVLTPPLAAKSKFLHYRNIFLARSASAGL